METSNQCWVVGGTFPRCRWPYAFLTAETDGVLLRLSLKQSGMQSTDGLETLLKSFALVNLHQFINHTYRELGITHWKANWQVSFHFDYYWFKSLPQESWIIALLRLIRFFFPAPSTAEEKCRTLGLSLWLERLIVPFQHEVELHSALKIHSSN